MRNGLVWSGHYGKKYSLASMLKTMYIGINAHVTLEDNGRKVKIELEF